MKCKKDFELRMKVLYLNERDLKDHLNECNICKESLNRAYQLYKDKKHDPILKSFPSFGVAKSREEFLKCWRLSLISKKERFDHYKSQLKEKMGKTSMKSLILELVTELVKSLAADDRKDKMERKKALYGIVEIMDGEFLDEEFEMFFGFTKERVVDIIEKGLKTEEKVKALPGK